MPQYFINIFYIFLWGSELRKKGLQNQAPGLPLGFEKEKVILPVFQIFFLFMEHSIDVFNYAVFHIYLGAGVTYACPPVP